MQKKLIALAVAALAGSAFAQTNVTIYGVVDAGFAHYGSSNSGKSSSQIISGGLSTSRIGFRGTEDLGNGLKAIFGLEYRLDVDKNTSIGGNFANVGGSAAGASGPARQQLVGLTGGFGTVAAGRLQTAAYDWAVKYQTLVASAFDAANAVTASAAGGFRINTGRDVRADNAVAYISPNFSGLTLAVNHAKVGEQTAGALADNRVTANQFSADYTNGPLAVGLVHALAKDSALGAALNQSDWALGGSYNFGVAKLNATYQNTKNKNGVGVAGNTNSAYHVGVAVPFGKTTILASYAANSIKSTAAADNSKAFNLAATYELSKRTRAYAGYAKASNGSASVGNSSAFYGAAAPASGTKVGSSDVIAVGVAHSF